MKYHAREATNWVKDITSAYNVGGTRQILPYDSRGAGVTNPVSHHSQTSGELNINQNNTFIRPQVSTPRSPSRSGANPVSHHAQMQTEIQQSQSSAQAPPQTSHNQLFTSRRVDLDNRGPTQEERFLLEYDEEGEPEDKSPPITPAAAPLHAEDSASATSRLDCGNAASQGRGPS